MIRVQSCPITETWRVSQQHWYKLLAKLQSKTEIFDTFSWLINYAISHDGDSSPGFLKWELLTWLTLCFTLQWYPLLCCPLGSSSLFCLYYDKPHHTADNKVSHCSFWLWTAVIRRGCHQDTPRLNCENSKNFIIVWEKLCWILFGPLRDGHIWLAFLLWTCMSLLWFFWTTRIYFIGYAHHFAAVLFCCCYDWQFVVVFCNPIFPYSSGLLYQHWGHHMAVVLM